MPVPLTHPGVYIQELTSPIRPIVGVPTSVAAFVGATPQGRTDDPVQVNSWSDYEREFGGLRSEPKYCLSYAVYLFFLNGGSTALVVRVSDPSDTIAEAQVSSDIFVLASSPGDWGESLTGEVDTDNLFDPKVNQFNLTISLPGGATESYPGANLIPGTPQYLPTLLASSRLVKPDPDKSKFTVQPKAGPLKFGPVPVKAAADANPPPDHKDAGGNAPAAPDPKAPSPPLSPIGDPNQKTGIYALKKADIFNILCLPVDPTNTFDQGSVLSAAVEFCVENRAMLIIDPPKEWENVIPLDFDTVSNKAKPLETASANAAVYYPNLKVTDHTGAVLSQGPCGAIAGVWAATDSSRGVWKAPAGTAASINGITDLAVPVDDGESGVLNPLGVNAMRTLPLIGPVVWGARTNVGADQQANQWKYVSIRRTALFIEESLRRGTQWAVFEPNDEPLWSSLRLNITTFMQGLFRQGAFQGSTPAEAYLVKCDKDNNPQDQIDLGIVNILVGFAPLYPAEFVIINIQQQAGQA
ncbi:MAG: phage tail sheath family protein [Solirubrobacteraceae bacterium]